MNNGKDEPRIVDLGGDCYARLDVRGRTMLVWRYANGTLRVGNMFTEKIGTHWGMLRGFTPRMAVSLEEAARRGWIAI